MNQQDFMSTAPQKEIEKQIFVNTQYVKDLSFENPHAPKSLLATGKKPAIDVTVDVRAKTIGEDLYEVELMMTCKASTENDKGEKEASFLCEVNYGGVFTIKGVTEAEKEPALLIFCPSLLFPFARRIIADSTRDGGFPPLMLDPIDFARLYAQRRAQEKKQA